MNDPEQSLDALQTTTPSWLINRVGATAHNMGSYPLGMTQLHHVGAPPDPEVHLLDLLIKKLVLPLDDAAAPPPRRLVCLGGEVDLRRVGAGENGNLQVNSTIRGTMFKNIITH
jgi:hypothetical protein